ncbi:fimbrillin family protein [Parabacteroides sp.]
MDKSSLFSSIGIAIICCLFVSSCSKEVEAGGDLPDGKYPLSFATSVKELRVTRSATADGTWRSGDRIAVKVDGDANVKTYTPSADAASATLTSTDPFYWKKSDETKKVSAWYYGDNTFRNEIQDTWSVQADQNANNGYQKSDFLYAPEKEITFAGRATTNLAFYHQTARVVINIENAEAATDANAIQSVTIGNEDNLALSGAYTEPADVNTTGTWDISSGTSGTITPKEISPTGTYLKSYSALVIPQAMSEKINKKFLAVTLTDGNTYYYTPANQEADLVAGQQYTYNITVKYGYLVVTVDMLSEWQEDGSSEATSIEPDETFTADQLKPGDYFYRTSDGNWTTSDGGLRALYPVGYGIGMRSFGYVMEDVQPDESKGTCIGIIVKLGKDASGDWADNCNYLKKGDQTSFDIQGYVLALEESDELIWGEKLSTGTNTELSTGFYGYSNTNTIKDYANKNGKDLQTAFPATYYATVSYGLIESAPENTSDWFLPSGGQGTYFSKVNEILLSSVRNATGNKDYSWKSTYWSSTDKNKTTAQVISADGGVGYSKSMQSLVRPWLAF